MKFFLTLQTTRFPIPFWWWSAVHQLLRQVGPQILNLIDVRGLWRPIKYFLIKVSLRRIWSILWILILLEDISAFKSSFLDRIVKIYILKVLHRLLLWFFSVPFMILSQIKFRFYIILFIFSKLCRCEDVRCSLV